MNLLPPMFLSLCIYMYMYNFFSFDFYLNYIFTNSFGLHIKGNSNPNDKYVLSERAL